MNKFINNAKMKFASLIYYYYSTSSSDNEVVSQLNKFGFYVKDDFYDTSVINEILSDLDKIPDEFFILYCNDKRIFGSQYFGDSIKNFHYDEYIMDISSKYLNSNVENLSTLYGFLTYNSDSDTGSGGGWHRDSLSPQFKSILYLTNVTKDHGPFQYVPKSHLYSNISSFSKKMSYDFFKTRFTCSDIDIYCQIYKQEVVEFIAKQGTLILADTRGLHTGKPINVGFRKAITNYFSPSLFVSKSNNIKHLDNSVKCTFKSS